MQGKATCNEAAGTAGRPTPLQREKTHFLSEAAAAAAVAAVAAADAQAKAEERWSGRGAPSRVRRASRESVAAVGAVMKSFHRQPSPSGLPTKAACRELELVYEAEAMAAGAPAAMMPSHVTIHTRVAAVSAAGVKNLVDVTRFDAEDLAPAEEQGNGLEQKASD